MADYINREKLLEHIKDVPTWEIDDKGVHDTKYPKGMFDCEDVVSSIENAPAADVEHVIRCKDCKWYSELACGEGELLGSQGWCNEVMARPMPSNGFCSFGERENNG